MDKKKGIMTVTRDDGCKYTGEWENDKPNGIGECLYPDGIKYRGQWKDGAAHGFGTVIMPDGRATKGTYLEGLRHGCFINVEADGKEHSRAFYYHDTFEPALSELMAHPFTYSDLFWQTFGMSSLTPQQRGEVISGIQDELYTKTGEVLCKGLTAEKQTEFERITDKDPEVLAQVFADAQIDPEEIPKSQEKSVALGQWLGENIPDYKERCIECWRSVWAHILTDGMNAGGRFMPPFGIKPDDDFPIEYLRGLLPTAFNRLQRGGIKTVGDLRTLSDKELIGIRNITRNLYDHILEVASGYDIDMKAKARKH